MKYKRIFLIVADSMGIGSDSESRRFYNGKTPDEGCNTLLHISQQANGGKGLKIPTLNKLGIYDLGEFVGTNKVDHNNSIVAKLFEKSNGKDTMTGHWEMMGIHTTVPFMTFTETGFPSELISLLEEKTGRKCIGNYAASGTEILKQLGEEALRDGSLIVYTSADSVLQIAAHEVVVSVEELYRCCEIAREICMKPEWMVGRIIARPFIGTNKDDFKRDGPKRHDLSVRPSVPTVMNVLEDNGLMVDCIGKISDIFDGYGVTNKIKTSSNVDGMNKTIKEAVENNFTGLCFVNLVEFDSEFGHRRNVQGYGECIETFDKQLGELISVLKDDDLVIVTADHGNDPTWAGSDHTREKVPFIAYSKSITNGCLINERKSFGDIGASVLHNFGFDKPTNLIGEPILELF